MILGATHVAIAVVVSAHIVLTKQDVRGAIGWVGLVWLAPVVGSVLYLVFGINRIRRWAGRMRGSPRRSTAIADLSDTLADKSTDLPAPIAPPVPPTGISRLLQSLATLVAGVTGMPLTDGNAIDPLQNGEEAYPAMLAAIDAATRSVGLATYIFDRGAEGTKFVDALGRAVARGVLVRVLIDDVGAHYSHPPVTHSLRGQGIPVAHFLPSRALIFHPYLNLRNHRKLLVADGRVAFCGGMNIRDGQVLDAGAKHPTQDVHFRVTGPVVRHLMSALAFDWKFTTGEDLSGDAWFPAPEPAGDVCARGIAAGPDENFETLLFTLLGALSQADQSIRMVTPYFLPDPPLIDALRVAALRGVQVEIVLPECGNLRAVQWAATAQLAQVVRGGCAVYLSRPPFDHSKLLVVDGQWSLIGSANWDPRSLRLNFEYNVECYSTDLGRRLNALIDAKRARARRLDLAELEGRSLAVKLRDGVAWLAQPYL